MQCNRILLSARRIITSTSSSTFKPVRAPIALRVQNHVAHQPVSLHLTNTRLISTTRSLRSDVYTNMYKSAEKHYEAAKLAMKLKDTKTAIDQYEEALAVYKKLNDKHKQWEMMYALSFMYISAQRIDEALFITRESLTVANLTGDKNLLSKSNYTLGMMYDQYLKKHEDAIKYYKDALNLLKELHPGMKTETIAKTNVALAGALANEGLHEVSVKYLMEALDTYKTMGDKAKKSAVLSLLARYNVKAKNYRDAIKALEEQRRDAQSEGDNQKLSKALFDLINTYTASGDHKGAIPFLNERMEIAKEAKDYEGVATSLQQLGICYNGMKEHEEAIKYYTQFLNMSRDLKEYDAEIFALMSLADTYAVMPNVQKAVEHAKLAAITATNMKKPEQHMMARKIIVDLYLSQDMRSEAKKELEDTLNIAEKENVRNARIGCARQLGEMAEVDGDLPQAVRHYSRMMEALEDDEDDVGRMNAFSKLVDLFVKMNKPRDAKIHFTYGNSIALALLEAKLIEEIPDNLRTIE
ncbi:nephrocystin 3 [Planoprotostelium fungivorum]|uniref:Tetratricopeptide repeat protein 29 n=1 Tax=Planoprotostelium fungivorum TaxID=1890364 RepID=A0A2P6MTI2_9EUKA|nr:hypothetical protein PROFUN_07415 [Planoprotostelium fungivorum]PRP87538.1 nephrocystin 3 [Planoprotostelium fungivorum]